MASTGAIGLVSVFAVDLLNLFYLSRLGDQAVVAAVGFAGIVGFYQISIGIGLTIGVGAVVSTMVGARRIDDARRLATTCLLAVALISLVFALCTAAVLTPLLHLLGADGQVLVLARRFLLIILPPFPFMMCGMVGSALLRSVGDARRSMNVTLVAAVVAAALDPLLIFGLHLGIVGAAISTVISRGALGGLALWFLIRHHRLLGRPGVAGLHPELSRVARTSLPAILTNLATPVGNSVVTHAIASFGASAVAGQAVIERISPMAFGIIYALTGAVGPIMAQNLGAGRPDRVRQTLRCSLMVVLGAVLGAWALLALAQTPLVMVFSARGDSAVLIRLFCDLLAGGFLFTGALFVANAAFNNLGHPLLSTGFNWGRATIGTVPLVMLALPHGPGWVLAAQQGGAMIFGTLAVITAFRVTARLGAVPLSTAQPVQTASGVADAAIFATPDEDAAA